MRDEDGYGYTDQRSKVHYTVLDNAFEAARASQTVFGVYEDKKTGLSREFHAIPDMDSSLFLTDSSSRVYYAGSEPIDAAQLAFNAVLVCESDAVSIEVQRLTLDDNADAVVAIYHLWFDTVSEAELPATSPVLRRRIKLKCREYENLLYCFDFVLYENGEAYFYDRTVPRTVAVPAEIASVLYYVEGLS